MWGIYTKERKEEDELLVLVKCTCYILTGHLKLNFWSDLGGQKNKQNFIVQHKLSSFSASQTNTQMKDLSL